MPEALPFIVLNLDKPRKLRFDLNSLIVLQKRYEFALSEIGKFLESCLTDKKAGLEKIRTIVWQGLKWDDPELTEEKAGELLHQYNALGVIEQVINQLIQSVDLGSEGLLKKVKRAVEEASGIGLPPSKQQLESDSGPKSFTD